MKRKIPNVFETTMHGTRRWVMDGRYHGKTREYFDTEDQAKGRAEAVYNEVFGVKIGSVSPELIMDARRAQEMLDPYDANVVAAAEFYRDHLKAKLANVVTVKEAVGKWLDHKGKQPIKPDTLTNYETKVNRFCDTVSKLLIAEVTHEQVHDWLHGLELSQVTKADYCGALKEFFDWCIFPKKWIKENPCQGIEFYIGDKPVEIFSVEETRELLEAAKQSDPDILIYVILCMFVGLRPNAEAMRVKPSDLNKNTQVLFINSTKTSKMRYISLEDGVCELLLSHDWDKFKYAVNWERRWNAFKYKLGFELWIDPRYIPEPRPEGTRIRKWPHDVMRHTFCSYHLAKFQNEALTIHKAGHSQRMFRKHYKRPIPQSEGVAFWGLLTPESCPWPAANAQSGKQ